MSAMRVASPPGLQISIATNETGTPVIVIPAPQIPVPSRTFALLCLLIFPVLFASWLYLTMSVISLWPKGPFDALFLLLSGAAGLTYIYQVFRVLRPTVPETLQLEKSGIEFDGGVWPFAFSPARRNRPDSDGFGRSGFFPKRTRCAISSEQLQSLRLRELMHGNRLTVDVETQRIEIGQGMTDVGREWLARTLANRYCLPHELVGC